MSGAAPSETSGTFRPPAAASALPHLGTYRRTLPVSVERMLENALDWEHLPHLHSDSFAWIECEDAGPWGWRARVGLPTREGPRAGRIELLLDREELRWVTRNLEGANAGAEIWTHLVVHGPRQLSVIVDFFVPDITGDARARLGEAFARVYHQLYDEDEAMMVAREAALGGERAIAEAEADVVEHEGRRLRLVDLDDGTLAVDARCPHWLGPLDTAEVRDGVIICPWHGYGFDVRTGACTTGQDCAMRPGRRVTRTDTGLQFQDEV